MQNRRTLLVGTALLALAATTAMPKSAQADDQQGAFEGTLTVQAYISTQCAVGDTTCSACVQNGGQFVDAQGIAQTTLGPLFAKVLKCAVPPSSTSTSGPYGTFVGTVTLSTTPPTNQSSLIPSPKDVLTMTYSGKNDDNGDFYFVGPFSGTWTVESGTGTFQGAQGSLNFVAVGGPPSVVATGFTSTMAGTAFYQFQGTINQGNSQ